MYLWVFLALFAVHCHCEIVSIDMKDGLSIVATNDTGKPVIRFYNPAADPLFHGSYEWTFLGIAEGEATEPVMWINSTRLEIDRWLLTTARTSTSQKFQFDYAGPATPLPPGKSGRIANMRIVTEVFDTVSNKDDIRLGFNFYLAGYKWQSPDRTNRLIFYFRFNNTLGSPASITRPDRLQIQYGYLQGPAFAHGMLYNNSDVERLPVQFYTPVHTGAAAVSNDTYFIVYDNFQSENLLHTSFLGYGLESRANLAALTALTCFGIVGLSCILVVLVIFGRKLDKRYGRRLEEFTGGNRR
eukprot:TRINITY_DN11314_c0_g1_i1.p1 TRINITY_DN11314_c0_g1~~TRINITY_DN11314_c0_g1_i1.p1  ORF type:complete len:299 (-),score=45.88 TRINITY_DN11314_c0_g1_i1:51-947(-)